MALVEMVGGDLPVAELPEHGWAGQAEDGLLGETLGGGSRVEPIGDGLIGGAVLGELGVKEVDGNGGPADTVQDTSPNADDHGPATDDHLYPCVQPLEVVGGCPADGMFDLAAGGVELLPEETLVIQEGDSYGRHSHVGSGAEEVPGEHSEATTERGDLIVQGDLHGEVGDGFGVHPVKSGAWTSESHTERQFPARPSEEWR